MAVGLDHILIPSRDKVASSRYLAEILGLDPPHPSGHFMAIELVNGVILDYDDREDFDRHHCGFHVDVEDSMRRSGDLWQRVSRITPIPPMSMGAKSIGWAGSPASTSTTWTATTWRSSPTTFPAWRTWRGDRRRVRALAGTA